MKDYFIYADMSPPSKDKGNKPQEDFLPVPPTSEDCSSDGDSDIVVKTQKEIIRIRSLAWGRGELREAATRATGKEKVGLSPERSKEGSRYIGLVNGRLMDVTKDWELNRRTGMTSSDD
jgi:hypothetical protein